MKLGRGLLIVAAITIVGIIISVDHSYYFRADINQAAEKYSVAPLPAVNPSIDKSVTEEPNKAAVTNKPADDKSQSITPSDSSSKQANNQPINQANNQSTSQPSTQSNIQPNAQSSTQSNIQPNAQSSTQASTQPNAQTNTQTNTTTKVPDVIPKAVEQKAGTIAKAEVQTDDFIKVASVLLGKLSLTEIKYLFDSASDNYWEVTSVEDIEKARSILFSKLSAEDLNQLYQLGKKYGRSMTIIDPDIDVADIKAKRIKYLEELRSKLQ